MSEGSEYTILAYKSDSEIGNGVLRYSRQGPIIELSNGEMLSEQSGIYFKLLDDSKNKLPINHDELVELKPRISVVLGFTVERTSQDMMYPPSTDGWLTYVTEGTNEAIYIVQNILGSTRKLLTITSFNDPEDFSAHRIYPYETSILKMKRDWLVQNEIRKIHRRTSDVFSILKGNPPSWESIHKLVEDVNIPNLSIKSTMGETLEQLVPHSFPLHARKQIIAFLAWLDKAEIQSEDSLDLIEAHSDLPIFSSLLTGHLTCLLDGVKPPSYVRIMTQADKGTLKLASQKTPTTTGRNPWYLTQMKLYELFPDWTTRVLNTVDLLNKEGRIITCLPISKNTASVSRKQWGERFALIQKGLIMRGYVQRKSLGLKTLVYVGAAHRWPHKHLELSARLGYQEDRPSEIQVMTMPQPAVERVARLLPSIHIIDWETNSINWSLYNSEKGRWRINASTILKSLNRNRSLRQLKNEFGTWAGRKQTVLNQEQVKILDMVSWGLFLKNFENNRYQRYYNIEIQTLKDTLQELMDQGVFKLYYLLAVQKLVSICINAKGPASHVCSLARSFLKHIPTSDVRIADEGMSCFIMSRVPEDELFNLLTKLPVVAADNEISLTALPVSAFISYRNNLYQRLLNDDGSWDDDISGLISQSRIRPKSDS